MFNFCCIVELGSLETVVIAEALSPFLVAALISIGFAFVYIAAILDQIVLDASSSAEFILAAKNSSNLSSSPSFLKYSSISLTILAFIVSNSFTRSSDTTEYNAFEAFSTILLLLFLKASIVKAFSSAFSFSSGTSSVLVSFVVFSSCILEFWLLEDVVVEGVTGDAWGAAPILDLISSLLLNEAQASLTKGIKCSISHVFIWSSGA